MADIENQTPVQDINWLEKIRKDAEEKAQPQNMTLIEPKMSLVPTPQKELEDDFVRQFYTTQMSSILEADKKYSDPSEFFVKASAELDGAMAVVPDADKEAVSAVPRITIDSLVEDKTEKAVNRAVADAETRNSVSVYEARDAAIEANKRNMPINAQAAYDTMYLDTIASERARGKMSAEEEFNLKVKYAQEVALSNLSKNLISDDFSPEQKLAMVKSLINGKTGNVAVDRYTGANERIEVVNKAIINAQRVDNYRESIQQQDIKVKSELFNDMYRDAAVWIVENNPTIDEIEEQKKKLLPLATTKEDIRAIGELEEYARPQRTSDMAIMEVEDAILDGRFNLDFVKDRIRTGILRGDAARRYLKMANEPLTYNLSSEAAKAEIETAKFNFENNKGLYNAWYRRFASRLSGRILSGEEIAKVAKDSYSEIGKATGKLPEEKTEEKIQFATVNGISDRTLDRILNTTVLRELSARNLEEIEQLPSGVLQNALRLAFKEEIESQKSRGENVYTRDESGNIITDENVIIDLWIGLAKKRKGF